MALIYKDRQRKNARIKSVTVAASANYQTANTVTTTPVEVGDANTLRLDLVVSAHVGGTGTLDVKVQTCATSGGTFIECTANGAATAAFPQVVATDGTQRLIVTGLDRFVRLSITKGGTTPNYTFAVTGEAV